MPNRDDYFRCRICKTLSKDDDCERDPITGVLKCPKGCVPSFDQPPYESPFDTDTTIDE